MNLSDLKVGIPLLSPYHMQESKIFIIKHYINDAFLTLKF